MLILKKSASAYSKGNKKISTNQTKSNYTEAQAKNIRSHLIFMSTDTYSFISLCLTEKL